MYRVVAGLAGLIEGLFGGGKSRSKDEGAGQIPSSDPVFKFSPAHTPHRGEPVKVGRYTIYAGGLNHLQPEDLAKFDYVIPLEPKIPTKMGVVQKWKLLGCPWKDFGSPPEGFREFLEEMVIPLLAKKKKILVYCVGSHGRTGTFIASLIALLETKEETPDPIKAVRDRHCYKAVETRAQAEFVFALREEDLPEECEKDFIRSFQSEAPYTSPYPYLGPPTSSPVGFCSTSACSVGAKPAASALEAPLPIGKLDVPGGVGPRTAPHASPRSLDEDEGAFNGS
jgi:hypothetical protein